MVARNTSDALQVAGEATIKGVGWGVEKASNTGRAIAETFNESGISEKACNAASSARDASGRAILNGCVVLVSLKDNEYVASASSGAQSAASAAY